MSCVVLPVDQVNIVVRCPASNQAIPLSVENSISVGDLFDVISSRLYLTKGIHFLSLDENGSPPNASDTLESLSGTKVCLFSI